MEYNAFASAVLTVLSAASANSQDLPLNSENSLVCSFTLRAGDNAILRTNEWNLAVNNGNNTLQQATFWTAKSTSSPLYSSAGRKCGFDPYLECGDNNKDPNTAQSTDRDDGPFAISNNGTLSFHNSTAFFLCGRNAFTERDDNGSIGSSNEDDLQDYPYIYPQKDTTDDVRDFQNCTQSTLVADRCFEGSNEYTVAAPAAIAMSVASTTNTATGTSIASITQTSSTTTASGSASASATTTANANIGGQMNDNNAVVVGLIFAAAEVFAWF